LNAWLAGMCGEEVPVTEEALKPKPPSRPKIVEATITETTGDNLKDICSANLCVIGFVDITNDGTSHSVQPQQNAILTAVLTKWNKDGKFKFVWVDRAVHGDMTTKFGIATEGPSLVVFNGKRSKFATADSFTEVAVHRLLEHVNTGDVKYQQL